MKKYQKIFICISVMLLCVGCTVKQTEDTNQTQTTQSGNHHAEDHHNDHH